MSKRRKILARGEEEQWKWVSFGSNCPSDMLANVVYASEHALTRAGIRDGNLVSMIECAKMKFYCEPWPATNTTGYVTRHIRFTIQANQFGMRVNTPTSAPQGVWNVHKLLDRPEVYMIHEESSWKSDTTVDFGYTYPREYDMTAPDGQGILFKGTNLWVTAMSHWEAVPVPSGQMSFSWYCLCRQVWVTPEYYAESRVSSAQWGMGGKSY